jgi:prevent-host-death family protein
MDVQATEAKAKLSELLDMIEDGQSVNISRRGRLIARLIPVEPTEEEARARRLEALERIRQCRASIRLQPDGPDELKRMAREGLA